MRQLRRGPRVCKCGALNSDMGYRSGCNDCMEDLQLSIRRAKREKTAWLERDLRAIAERLARGEDVPAVTLSARGFYLCPACSRRAFRINLR
jgi:hypothetical protein